MKKLFALAAIALLVGAFPVLTVALPLNPGFESGTGNVPDNWTKGGGLTETWGRTNALSHSGSWSCEFDDPTSAYDGRYITSDEFLVSGNTDYDISGWFYVAETAGLISEMPAGKLIVSDSLIYAFSDILAARQ